MQLEGQEGRGTEEEDDATLGAHVAAQLRELLLPDGSINEAAVAALGLELDAGGGEGASSAAAMAEEEPDLDALLSLEGVDIAQLFAAVEDPIPSAGRWPPRPPDLVPFPSFSRIRCPTASP